MAETPAQKAVRVGHCDVHWHWHDPEEGFRLTSYICRCDCKEETLPKESQRTSDHVYIVFEGTPVIYDETDYENPLEAAEKDASKRAEHSQLPHTIMMVPKSSLEATLVAVYQGTVIMTLEQAES